MAAPVRLTVVRLAFTRLLLDVLTVRAPHFPATGVTGAAHAVGLAERSATRPGSLLARHPPDGGDSTTWAADEFPRRVRSGGVRPRTQGPQPPAGPARPEEFSRAHDLREPAGH